MNNLAFLFPGQGSQFVGMGKHFWNEFALAKRLFEEASDAISLDIKKLCFNGDMNELTKTMNALTRYFNSQCDCFSSVYAGNRG